MGLKCKLVSQTSIKSGDVFERFRFTNHLSNACPEIIQSVDLYAGQWGTVGSIVIFNCLLDGKLIAAKEIIEAIDEEKKSITFKVLEGEFMGLYNSFKIILNEDSNGADKLVTWTFDYDKKTEDVPEPHALMDRANAITKQIERYTSLVPN